ncbi:MAG: hypothetical protein U0930_07400 [Pirellulales bacterium]
MIMFGMSMVTGMIQLTEQQSVLVRSEAFQDKKPAARKSNAADAAVNGLSNNIDDCSGW